MHVQVDLKQCRPLAAGTELNVVVPDKDLTAWLIRNCISKGELRIDDGRGITAEQRKKTYAMVKDISDHTGYLPEEQKEWLKYLHIQNTGCDYFSLSDCSITTAREFLNTMIDYALKEGIQLAECGLNRTDDIDYYLIACIRHKKCCICGSPADIHHVDAIGMGGDRRHYDDSQNKIIALCRKHHTIAHQRGNAAFLDMYKVYGIVKERTKEISDSKRTEE